MFNPISFAALIPREGFRWVFQKANGTWEIREPPGDWPETDYQAARIQNDDALKPRIAHRYYVAASWWECAKALQVGEDKVISYPDLYLRFASERASPSRILEFANRFGLLKHETSRRAVRRNSDKRLATVFANPRHGLQCESAFDWMETFEFVRSNLDELARLGSGGNVEELRTFIKSGFNFMLEKAVTIQLEAESLNKVRVSAFAASLHDALPLQLGMSVANRIVHRQCEMCSHWYAISPGAGRPEKKFCSDACRQRAYRMRKGDATIPSNRS